MAFLSSVNSSSESLGLGVDSGTFKLHPSHHCLPSQAVFRTLTLFGNRKDSNEISVQMDGWLTSPITNETKHPQLHREL